MDEEKEITPQEEKEEESAPAETENAAEERGGGNNAYKFSPVFAAPFAVALLVFFIALGFGKVLYGMAAFAFTGVCAQFAEFYLKSKQVSLLVTACLSGVAALTMLILSIVTLCVT